MVLSGSSIELAVELLGVVELVPQGVGQVPEGPEGPEGRHCPVTELLLLGGQLGCEGLGRDERALGDRAGEVGVVDVTIGRGPLCERRHRVRVVAGVDAQVSGAELLGCDRRGGVGQYSNLNIFDVADNERLHEILWNLPLFSYMQVEVTPLATHPSAISAGG